MREAFKRHPYVWITVILVALVFVACALCGVAVYALDAYTSR